MTRRAKRSTVNSCTLGSAAMARRSHASQNRGGGEDQHGKNHVNPRDNPETLTLLAPSLSSPGRMPQRWKPASKSAAISGLHSAVNPHEVTVPSLAVTK